MLVSMVLAHLAWIPGLALLARNDGTCGLRHSLEKPLVIADAIPSPDGRGLG